MGSSRPVILILEGDARSIQGGGGGGHEQAYSLVFFFFFLPVKTFPPFCDHISFIKLSLGKCLIRKKI